MDDEYDYSEVQYPDCEMGYGEAVECKFCGNLVPSEAAHLHQGEYVGDECCWDERLRTTE